MSLRPANYMEALERKQAQDARKRENLPRNAVGAVKGSGAPRKGLKRGRIKAKPMTPAKRADIAFSLMIRERALWRCARCGKDHSERHEGLEASHFFNVRYYAVRYDVDNADALCGRFSNPNCHTGPDGFEYQKKGAYLDFMRTKLGHKGFTRLWLKSETHIKLREAVAAYMETQKDAVSASPISG